VKASEIRQRFLQYFEQQGHQIVASSPLLLSNDPTLYFTNAGMVQFKDVFTGAEQRPNRRATTCQKVLRVSGKHNDLENVGRTPRHHTFFEMLGNFSFGDYFKAEAIRWAWQLLTRGLGIPAERLWVTIYEKDDEAEQIWLSLGEVPAERIQRLGEKDNFWSMGPTGPCGPCTEIHYDHGPEFGPEGGPAAESPRYVEIWNLVFMQYERFADGRMEPLPRPSIDTGGGLERIAAAVQGVYSNYDTDLFRALIDRIAADAGHSYGRGGEKDVAVRVIADHARAAAFLISEGLMPSNEGRNYVLRRIMRRAIRFGVKLGHKEPFFYKATQAVAEHMGEAWPELREREGFVTEVVRAEEERFAQTMHTGLSVLERIFSAPVEGGPPQISGEDAFRLYDTYGFPLDLTELIAGERGWSVDSAGYEAAMQAQKALGRAHWKGSGTRSIGEAWLSMVSEGISTAFVGYEADRGEGQVLALLKGSERAEALQAGDEGAIVVDQTPFYAESGGQVGDTGWIRGPGLRARVTDTRKPAGGLFAHMVVVEEGSLELGQLVQLEVEGARRDRTRKNHSATHLLHAALRAVLGTHVTQKGSLVDPERLRFDFAHHKAMSAEELQKVEDMVYAQILGNLAVGARVTSIDEARAEGAMALFGEKYGDRVRVLRMGEFSVELCGGTHVSRTGDIGLFRIQSESGVAAGVRRIEAVTGEGALAQGREREALLGRAAELLKVGPDQLVEALQRVLDDRKRLDRELDQTRRELARSKAGDLTQQARRLGDITVLAAEIDAADANALREEADRLRDQLAPAAVLLAAKGPDGSVKLVATVSKEVAGKRVHAGNLLKAVAAVMGGTGGGRPDMAQGGGKDASALPAALARAYELVSP
jgi:alanyl-tRNA synthetase